MVNKEELIKFIFNTWRKANPQLLKGVEVFLAHEEHCHRLFDSNGEMMCSEIRELYCDHEEADTQMILHTMHACQRCWCTAKQKRNLFANDLTYFISYKARLVRRHL